MTRIKVHNRKYVGTSFDPIYTVAMTPATCTQGWLWWKQKTLGWAIVQTITAFDPDCNSDKWVVIFWTDAQDTALKYLEHFNADK